MDQKTSIDNKKLQSLLDKLKLLTKREKEIAALLSKGMTSKEIGEKLFRSQHTIDSHRRNILKKLEISDTSCLCFFKIDMND